MSSDWSQVKLGNLVNIKHGFAFKGEFFSDAPTSFQLTTPGNFAIGGGFQSGKGKFYSGPVPEDYVLRAGDLLVTMTDLSKAADTLGYAAVVPDSLGTTWLHNQRVGLISIKPDASITQGFVHYLMRSPEYRHWVVSTATGSTVRHTSPGRICEFEFSLPPIKYQHFVAEMLGALDDRITLLRETNTTLEAITQALFKSWFVDFDPVHAKMQGRAPEGMDEATAVLFPDSFDESDLEVIPKGWEWSTVGKAFVLTMGQSPPGDTYNQKADGLPFYQGRTDFGFRFPTKRIYCNAPTRLAEIGDALVSVRAPVGDVNMAIETCCIGRGVAAVRHSGGCSGYTFYTMRNLGERFKNFDSEGTVFGSINKKDFDALPVLAPSHPVLLAFDKFSKVLDGRIAINEEQIRLLVELRDALLPRLISGTLKVSSEESLVDGGR
jgi:type I restriction enzyme S subunit